MAKLAFNVTTVPDDERAKADSDPQYAPKEVVVDIFFAEHWRGALLTLRRRIQAGEYPDDAQLVEVE